MSDAPERPTAMRPWYRLAVTLAGWIIAIVARRRVTGAERVPKSGGFILASNHGSFWDPPVVAVSTPRELTFMAKQELFEVPLFGPLIRSLGAIPIRRNAADPQGLTRAREAIANGGVLLVFPEGGRMKDGRLHPARPGLGLLASQTRVPIVPVYVSGTNHIRRCVLRLEEIRVTIGEPLPESAWMPGSSTTPPTGRDLYQAIGDRIMREIALLAEQAGETTRSGDAPATGTSHRGSSQERGERT